MKWTFSSRWLPVKPCHWHLALTITQKEIHDLLLYVGSWALERDEKPSWVGSLRPVVHCFLTCHIISRLQTKICTEINWLGSRDPLLSARPLTLTTYLTHTPHAREGKNEVLGPNKNSGHLDNDSSQSIKFNRLIPSIERLKPKERAWFSFR